MTDKTALGDRMKRLEAVTRAILPPRTHTIIRVDGVAFHSFLRHAEKPYDRNVMEAMDAVAEALCGRISGSVFAFTQSDECSILVTDFSAPGTQPWYGGVVQKIASVSASIATVAFNRTYQPYGGRPENLAMFDARVFTIPDPAEVVNYFLWRQRDCVRNSITMAAQAVFPHKRLHGVNSGQMQELLWSEHGINWNDYPDGCKRGRVTVRHTAEQEITYTDKRSGEENTTTAIRSKWQTEGAPHFTSARDGVLASMIPTRGVQ
jgi:tRNA(His) guanylyltransferase